MGVIVVEELVIIIGIGQFKRHCLEEHVNLINCQNTVVQSKAGVKNGLSKQVALTIATQTVLATAENLSLGSDSPHDLIDKVCSPGGTTIAGLMDLERTGLTHSVVSSIDTTIAKAKKL